MCHSLLVQRVIIKCACHPHQFRVMIALQFVILNVFWHRYAHSISSQDGFPKHESDLQRVRRLLEVVLSCRDEHSVDKNVRNKAKMQLDDIENYFQDF